MMKEFGRTRKVTLDVYDVCKYTAKTVEELNEKQIKYSGCIGFEVVSGKEAEVIESETDGSWIDDFTSIWFYILKTEKQPHLEIRMLICLCFKIRAQIYMSSFW